MLLQLREYTSLYFNLFKPSSFFWINFQLVYIVPSKKFSQSMDDICGKKLLGHKCTYNSTQLSLIFHWVSSTNTFLTDWGQLQISFFLFCHSTLSKAILSVTLCKTHQQIITHTQREQRQRLRKSQINTQDYKMH